MGLPCSLTMDEMTLYIIGNFEWYRMEVVFLAMLPNDAVKLGVLRKWIIGIMESALKQLRIAAKTRTRARGLTAYPPSLVVSGHRFGGSVPTSVAVATGLRALLQGCEPIVWGLVMFETGTEYLARIQTHGGRSRDCAAGPRAPFGVRDARGSLEYASTPWYKWSGASIFPPPWETIFYAMVLNDTVELRVISRDVEHKMAKIKMTARLRSPDELPAKGAFEGNLRSNSGSHRSTVEVESISTSFSSKGEVGRSERAVLKKMGRAWEEPAREVMANGTVFPGAPERSDMQHRPSTHFPNPKVMASLKRPELGEKYLLPTGYRFIIPEANTTINKPPSKCIASYRVAFSTTLGSYST
ncbi:hypothetical protein Cgig2_028571 [Carnegiea gigantea]|uniref:Uncharacterized protein n=1 Tax=Carnegiea gigantea TaxID=171969 RepID=A0A9Q1K337_9CARY|nr:hypothetical protein Cgig2_028571 [Carnegiea gigantea]